MTDKLRQAAEMALKALEVATTPLAKDRHEVLAAMNALRQALKEPDTEADYWRKKAEQLEQENFAWRTKLGVRGYEMEIESLRQALAEPDTGTDRGAWADVPDANKWVDELRGDEPTAEHWLTKELFAEYLELIYYAINDKEDRHTLFDKAYWMKTNGDV